MRQKVLSSRIYRGLTIEHIENEEFRGTGWGWGSNHAARYVKHRFWWIKEMEWDEPTFREACAHIDDRYSGNGILVDEEAFTAIDEIGGA